MLIPNYLVPQFLPDKGFGLWKAKEQVKQTGR
jgi:hypothetical protein